MSHCLMHLAPVPQGFPEMAENFVAASFKRSPLRDIAAELTRNSWNSLFFCARPNVGPPRGRWVGNSTVKTVNSTKMALLLYSRGIPVSVDVAKGPRSQRSCLSGDDPKGLRRAGQGGGRNGS